MRILVLSFYYRPDLSAGSFRTTALVGALRELAPPGSSIDVVTTGPNRYHSYTVDAPAHETEGEVSIFRIPLPPHRSGLLDQSRAFLAFASGVARRVRGCEYDVVFATSSRLMTAALGAWTARRVGAALYLDIRDIFVDTLREVLPRATASLVAPLFDSLERWTVRRADRVNLVSPGFTEYFRSRYPAQRFSVITNGVDSEFIAAAPATAAPARRDGSREPLTVLYAGNLGDGQGLHAIVPQLAKAMGPDVRFRIIGGGGRRDALVATLAAAGATSVTVEPPLPRAELVRAYRDADVLFVHLNDHEAFKKVLPSKLFEYAALGKPVWAGVAGFAAEFVTSEIDNAAVFPPCDVDAALCAFSTLAIHDAPRSAFVARYARSSVSRALAIEILALGGG